MIALEPNTPKFGITDYDSGEMRVAFIRGNRRIKMLYGADVGGGGRLYGGAVLSNDSEVRHESMVAVDISQINPMQQHFGNKFHIYGLKWSPDELVLTVDGYEYGRVPCNFSSIYQKAAWQRANINAPLGEFVSSFQKYYKRNIIYTINYRYK